MFLSVYFYVYLCFNCFVSLFIYVFVCILLYPLLSYQSGISDSEGSEVRLENFLEDALKSKVVLIYSYLSGFHLHISFMSCFCEMQGQIVYSLE